MAADRIVGLSPKVNWNLKMSDSLILTYVTVYAERGLKTKKNKKRKKEKESELTWKTEMKRAEDLAAGTTHKAVF